jgi:hypothetical protein
MNRNVGRGLIILAILLVAFVLTNCSSIEDNCTDDGCPSFHELNND